MQICSIAFRRFAMVLAAIPLVACGERQQAEDRTTADAEVIIVGAGLSGLSAAIELGRDRRHARAGAGGGRGFSGARLRRLDGVD
jgi:hypothetical protein